MNKRTVSFQVDEALNDWLHRKAKAQSTSVSSVLRQLVIKEATKQSKKED